MFELRLALWKGKLREIIVGLNRDLGMTIFMNAHLLSEVAKTCTSIGVLTAGPVVLGHAGAPVRS